MDKLNITDNFKPNLNNVKQCIYCEKSLPAKSKEHIFNSCWGGVHKTGQIICDECNNSFSAIDGVFDIYTRFIMNANQFKGQRHKEIPEIATDSEYYIGPGGKPTRNPSATVIKDEDGMVRVALNAKSKSESRKLILSIKEEIESKLGRKLTSNEEEHIYKQIRESEYTSEKVGTIGISAALNIHSQYRSAAHTILKCLTMYDTQMLELEEVNTLKRFARFNEGEWREFAIGGIPNISIQGNFTSSLEKLNSVEIFYSAKLRKVIGRLNILGRLERWILISNNYEGDNKILFVFENIERGGKIGTIQCELNDISFPIINIKNSDSFNGDFFGKELENLAQQSLNIDAPIHDLQDKISRIISKNAHINNEVIQHLTSAFLEFGKLFLSKEITKDSEVMLEDCLIKLGMTSLIEKYEGEQINNERFSEEVSNILESYMIYITGHLNR